MNMMTIKKISTLLLPLFCLILLIVLIASLTALTEAQELTAHAATEPMPSRSDGIARAPARFELEMQPGSETTVVINLDYHTAKEGAGASRIVASLNDWNINQSGELQFYRAGTLERSASSWLIYSPSEVTVQPGQTH